MRGFAKRVTSEVLLTYRIAIHRVNSTLNEIGGEKLMYGIVDSNDCLKIFGRAGTQGVIKPSNQPVTGEYER